MKKLTVWAPEVEKVEAEIQGKRLEMNKKPRGWWEIYSPSLENRTDYGFILDGKGPFPDPCSAWQPHGVHGLSRYLDHSLYPWKDQNWQPPPISSAIIYEIHTGTFSPEGTFDGIINGLEYLSQLGITHIELMPVNGFSGTRGWGYDGVNLFAPHQTYGGPEGLKRLVEACHNQGLAVILDVVYNHLGPEGNYLEQYGPYFTERYSSPWGPAINFDGPESDQVRRFFCKNALMWLRDYHFDGLRIDAVHSIVDTSAIHFLEQLASEVKLLEAQLGRHLTLIAESDLNDPRIINTQDIGGYGLQAQWNDDFHHALHAVLTGEQKGYYTDFGSLADLAKALKQVFVFDGRYSSFRRRVHGRPVSQRSGHRFIGYLQNHDQVGNRAQGERIGHLVSQERLMIGAGLVLTAPFVPLLFQGEEWNASGPFLYFTDHQDPDLGQAVREGRCKEFSSFGWKAEEIPDPQKWSTFDHSRLNWDEQHYQPHSSILYWYRRLIHLRRCLPDLNDERLEQVQVFYDQQGLWLVMRRGQVTVVVNFSGQEQWIPLVQDNSSRVLISSKAGLKRHSGKILLPSKSIAILGPGPDTSEADKHA